MKIFRILKLVPKAVSEFFSGLLTITITSHWTGEKSAELYVHVMGGLRNKVRITAGFQIKFYSNRRLSECRSNHFEEGYWKDF